MNRSLSLSQWYTPPALARRVVRWAALADGMRVLEPSAGRGALASEIMRAARVDLTCIDADAANVEHLRGLGYHALCGDFLAYDRLPMADIAIMNPPYESGAEGTHVAHALAVAPRAIAILRLQSLASMQRWEALWSRARLTRMAVCVRRPAFSADGGGTFEVVVVEVQRARGQLELGTDTTHAADVRIEWWRDDWKAHDPR